MSQLDLFGLAKLKRNAGMSAAADAQERRELGWSHNAYQAIVRIARSQEYVHVDDVITCFTAKPKSPNAWGAVWMRAIKDKIIQRTGSVKPCKSDAGKHAHQYPVYRSLITETRHDGR